MITTLRIRRAGPLATIQDDGRFGWLAHGVGASGPMDRSAYARLGGGHGAIEFTMAGLELEVQSGNCSVGFAGGDFRATLNGRPLHGWPGRTGLATGDILAIAPGDWGNYGYVRFDGDLAIAPVLGSIATSSRARLGGIGGRPLQTGDVIELQDQIRPLASVVPMPAPKGPIRVTWGLHADLFPSDLRQRFVASGFAITTRMDRMGIRLADPEAVFAGSGMLSLNSDAVVPGDIQILGDGTPIVLMRDHQPTGGYPRLATVISADLDRFAQLRPGAPVAFRSVTVEHAQRLLRSGPA